MSCVDKLRSAGIRVAVASNQQSHRANIMANNLGYRSRFDELFFSCELGCVKPDHRFFGTILSHLKIRSRQVLFIDDHLENVSGARKAGIQSERYHIDQGFQKFQSILEHYNLHVA